MINKQMKILVEKRKNIDPQNDYLIQKCWDEELNVLTKSLENTIEYLKEASEEEILWISEIFDDLIIHFNSIKLINVYKQLQIKFPNISKDIAVDIENAERELKTINKQMKIITDKIKNIKDSQDGSFTEYYHQALEVLSASLENTIEYFKTASEEEVYWLSCTWDELSFKFKSQELVNTFLELQTKYPKIAKDLDVNIESAKAAMNYVR